MAETDVSIKLVNEIEKHVCLYDYTIKSYCYDRAKTKAWDEISASVNLSGNFYHTIIIQLHCTHYL